MWLRNLCKVVQLAVLMLAKVQVPSSLEFPTAPCFDSLPTSLPDQIECFQENSQTKIHWDIKWNGSCQGLEEGGMFNEYGISVLQDERDVEIVVIMAQC